MLLPLFNLPELIKIYNQQKGKKINLKEDFGFPYFQYNLLEACQQTIAGINNSAELFIFSSDENQHIKERQSQLNKWQNFAHASPEVIGEFYRRFKNAYVLPALIQEKKALIAWRRQYYPRFCDTKNWLSFVTGTLPLTKFEELKVSWQEQALLVLHSHQAISQIAFKLLPKLIKHHQQALKHLKWYYFSIPRPVYTAYQNYLKDFLAQAQSLQQKLADSMSARLKVFDETKLEHADIMVHVADQLQLKHPPCSEPLTTQQFGQFHRYVEQHGSDTAKKQVNELSWTKHQTVLSLKAIEKQQTKLFVPEKLKSDIPPKIRKPEWLFKGANLRHNLCERHSLDFVKLQQLPDVADLIINVNKPIAVQQAIKSIAEKQKIAEQLLAETQEKPYTELGFWQRGTRNFLNNYRVTLNEYYIRTINTQINLGEKILQSLATQLLELKESTKIYDTLTQLLDDLHHLLLKQQCKDSSIIERFTQLKKQSESILENYRTLNRLDQMSEGILLSPIEFEETKLFLITLPSSSSQRWLSRIQPQIREMYQKFRNALKLNLTTSNKDELSAQYIHRVEQLYEVLNIVSPDRLTQTLPHLLKRYFLNYLNVITHCGINTENFIEKESIIENAEKTLSLLAGKQPIYIGTATLAEHVTTLSQLRQRKQFYDLQAEAESLSLVLGEHYLIERVKKDTQKFDQQISTWLQENPNLHCSDEAIQLAFKWRDALTNMPQNASDEEVVKELQLTTTEQALIGLKTDSETSCARKVIPPLMKMSSQAQQLKQHMQQSAPTYTDKLTLLQNFRKQTEQTLSELKPIYHISETIGYTKNHSPLFFKKYIPDPSIENQAQPQSSLTERNQL